MAKSVVTVRDLLKFRCTGCGNCCKEPLLPLTGEDLSRLVTSTGADPMRLVRFVARHAINMDHEPEGFVLLRRGWRVMVLAHVGGSCIYLGEDNRCSVYTERPLGCRVYPLDATFGKSGKLLRLELIQATDCPYEVTGKQDIRALKSLHQRYDRATERYHAQIRDWNIQQQNRKKKAKPVQGARRFLAFLGVQTGPKPERALEPRSTPLKAGEPDATALP